MTITLSPIPHNFCYHLTMKRLLPVLMVFGVFLGSAGESWSGCVGSVFPGGPCSVGPGGGLSVGPGGGLSVGPGGGLSVGPGGGLSVGPGGGLSVGPGGGLSVGPNNFWRTIPGVKRLRGMPRDWRSSPGVAPWVYKVRTLPDEAFTSEVMLTLRKGRMEYENKNYQRAFLHFTPLANLGFSYAQLHLGLMYLYGNDVGKDFSRAKKWLELASTADNDSASNAKHALAFMYADGKGVPQDHKIAGRLYKSAAEGGFAGSQAMLSILYASGEGMEQNSVYAYMWANVAELNGQSHATGLKNMVAEVLNPTEISTAQKLARECVRKKYKGC
jgi:hypothetical protein